MNSKRPYMIDRRRILRGLGGATLGLPLLDAFSKTSNTAQAAVAPGAKQVYSVFMMQANGVAQAWAKEVEQFWPTTLTGPITAAALAADATRATSELKDHAAKLTFIKGVSFAFAGNGCGHSGGCNQVLTAAKVSAEPRGAKSLAMGESIDNRIARELTPTREPLALYAGRKTGYIDDAMSYRGPLMLRSADNNPLNAYQRMIGLGQGAADEMTAKRLLSRRKSVNDLIRSQMTTLLGRKELSKDDRARLDLHQSSIRDMELAMVKFMTAEQIAAMQAMNGKHRDPLNMEAVARLQADLIVFGLSTDYARTATLQIGDGNDGTEYVVDGLRLPNYHMISHRIYSHGGDGEPITNAVDLHHKIDRIHARMFKYLVDKMAALSLPGGGSLLDSSFAVWTNSLANGPPHGYQGVPFIIAGSAGGQLKTGHVVQLPTKTYNNKLFNTLLHISGVRKADGSPPDDFGDVSLAKGNLPQLLA